MDIKIENVGLPVMVAITMISNDLNVFIPF